MGVVMDTLRLAFAHDDDGTGELFMHVCAGGFVGLGSAWFNREDLLTFSDRLETYPLDPNDPPLLAGGAWGEDDTLTDVWLSIGLRPYDALGRLLLSFRVASKETRSELKCETRTWAVIGYNDASRIARALRALAAAPLDEVTLEFEAVG
jgi:hypothetical protein